MPAVNQTLDIEGLGEIALDFLDWSKSSVDYGRKLVNSALEGARKGEDEFLRDDSLGPYLEQSARNALVPAAIGACIGIMGGCLENGRHSRSRTFAYGLLGGVIGLGVGLIWESRPLTASVASGAWKKISQTRDEHWFEKNPIDYA